MRDVLPAARVAMEAYENEEADQVDIVFARFISVGRQQATLRTRPDKQLRSLAEMTEQWRERASTVLGMDAQAWAKGVGADDANRWLRAPDLTDEHSRDLAAVVLHTVEEKRSTWSRWNLHAEAARQLMGSRFVTARDRLDATERVVAARHLRVGATHLTGAGVHAADVAAGGRHVDVRAPVRREVHVTDAARCRGPTARCRPRHECSDRAER